MRYRTSFILACLPLALSCGQHASLPGSSGQSSDSSGAEQGGSPETSFATHDEYGVAHPVDLSLHQSVESLAARVPQHVDYLLCDQPHECHRLLRLAENEPLYGTLRSPSGLYELIVHGDPAVADVFDLRTGSKIGTFVNGGWMRGWHNGALRWLDDERILAKWGAGTYVGAATLYDTTGETLLSVGADAVVINPSQEFLATFTPTGAPGPDAGHLQIYNLRAADPSTPIPLPASAVGALPLADVLFGEGYAVVLIEADVESTFTRVDITLEI